MNRNFRVLLGVCVIVGVLFCAGSALHAGNYLLITDLGTSAEMIALGGIEGFSESSNTVFENPAALGTVAVGSVAFFSASVFEEVNYTNFSAAIGLQKWGTLGFGTMSAGVDDIPSTIETIEGLFTQSGSFNYKNTVTKIGYQYPLRNHLSFFRNVSLGVGYNSYSTTIGTVSASASNYDLGAFYDNSRTQLSLAIHNVVPTQVEYSDSADPDYSATESLTRQGIVAIQHRMGDWKLLAQGKRSLGDTLGSFGFKYVPGYLRGMSLIGGYKDFNVANKTGSSATFGVGIKVHGVSMHAAYERSSHADFDSILFFSAAVSY